MSLRHSSARVTSSSMEGIRITKIPFGAPRVLNRREFTSSMLEPAAVFGDCAEAIDRLRTIFQSLAPAPDRGWAHVGPVGAGHFVKMVHNGIEYGLMQAYAEGFALLHKKTEFSLDLAKIAELWRHGSVIRSWLLDLTAEALAQDATLENVRPYVADSGEGRWTVMEAIDLSLCAPVITLSLMERFRSRDEESFADRLLAVMRNKFGGHDMKTK